MTWPFAISWLFLKMRTCSYHCCSSSIMGEAIYCWKIFVEAQTKFFHDILHFTENTFSDNVRPLEVHYFDFTRPFSRFDFILCLVLFKRSQKLVNFILTQNLVFFSHISLLVDLSSCVIPVQAQTFRMTSPACPGNQLLRAHIIQITKLAS